MLTNGWFLVDFQILVAQDNNARMFLVLDQSNFFTFKCVLVVLIILREKEHNGTASNDCKFTV